MQKATFPLATLALIAVFAVGITALFPARAEAACNPFVRTANGWGNGSTCNASKLACEANAYASADATCTFGVCQIVGVTFTNECSTVPGGFMSDCVMSYKCTALPHRP
ncbi:MAG: hypothetical protein AAF657_16440 [Acidobacteriota bacterium]